LEAIVADEYAQAVMEAARLHRRLVARLVDEMRVVETRAEAERIKAELMTAQDQYETILMTEMVAVKARTDWLAVQLRELEKRNNWPS
jgi:hypothetical protein